MNWCYGKRQICKYANGAGFCTQEECTEPWVDGKTYDSVHAPQHYASQDIEPIEYMRAAMTNEEFVGYCCGNIIKYCSRWRDKNGIEDLKKARQYLDWMIEAAQKEDKNGSSEA